MINDRNLVILCITVLVASYVVATNGSADAGDIIEKAIIALGSLATGSILGGVKIPRKTSETPETPKTKTEVSSQGMSTEPKVLKK